MWIGAGDAAKHTGHWKLGPLGEMGVLSLLFPPHPFLYLLVYFSLWAGGGFE